MNVIMEDVDQDTQEEEDELEDSLLIDDLNGNGGAEQKSPK